MNIDGILKGHDIFQSLSLDEAHQISEISSVKEFNAGENIFSYGQKAEHVYILMKGSISLRLPAENNDYSLVISKVEKGELFGLSPLLDSPRYTATAQCEEASEILFVEAKPLRELLRRDYHAGFDVMNRVAHIYFNRYINVLKNLQGVVSQISLIR